MQLSEKKKLYLKAKEAYYNQEPIMSDAKFDKLEDSIRKEAPNWKELGKTGVRVQNKKTEVKLPRFMPSLAKAYPEKIQSWLNKHQGPKVVMDKLDGSSLFCRYSNRHPVQLITRGDGELGGDISFLLPHLSLPHLIKVNTELCLRLEAVMDEDVFQKKWSRKAKGDKGFDNSRNMVNGLLNRREPHPALKDIRLIVLGVFDLNIKTGLAKAVALGFDVVHYELVGDDFSPSKFLARRRKVGKVNIDGIVIAPTSFNYNYPNADKAKNIIAYKENDEGNAAKAKVKDIVYQISGYNRIVPKAEIEPTVIDGVTVKFVTLNNAQWMLERKIGIGTTVSVVRSGGVIPKIVGWDGKGKIKYPDVKYEHKSKDFIALEMTKEAAVRILQRFVVKLGIEFLARKTLASLYDVGVNTPAKLIKLAHSKTSISTLSSAGLGPNQSVKVRNELRRVLCAPVPLIALMNASGAFDLGVGERKLQKLVDSGINLLDIVDMAGDIEACVDHITQVKGFGRTTAELIATGLEDFSNWFTSINVQFEVEVPRKAKKSTGKLSELSFTWTGYRSKDEEKFITSLGGTIVPFGSKTDVLFFTESGKASSKVAKAGGKAMTFKTFVKTYKLK